ncbi:putative START domain-containing protein [Helianthus anomalus]
MLPAGNGGTIELVFTQVYAPTILAPARDFWTLRYTSSSENGSLVAFVVTLETNSFTILQYIAIWGNLVVYNWIWSALPRSGMYTIMYRLCRQLAY